MTQTEIETLREARRLVTRLRKGEPADWGPLASALDNLEREERESFPLTTMILSRNGRILEAWRQNPDGTKDELTNEEKEALSYRCHPVA